MKKLNELNYNDIFNGSEFSYKDFIGFYKGGYVTLYYKNKNNYINTFMTYSNNIAKIKAEIKREIKKHDIKELLNFSIDSLKNNGFNSEDIEKINSYVNIQYENKENEKMLEYLENEIKKYKEYKKLNNYLENEIKEHFIYRIVRK